MPLPEDWRAFIESLNSNGIEKRHACQAFGVDDFTDAGQQ
jgi:hypothetical protein